VTFAALLDKRCSLFALQAQTISDMTVVTGQSTSTTHTEYIDTKSVTYGDGTNFDLCGARTYTLIDTATGVAPPFATHATDAAPNTYKIDVTTDASMHQKPDLVYNLKLVTTLASHPTVTIDTLFTVTVTDPCPTTSITSPATPADLSIVITESDAQTITGYTDTFTTS